MQPVQAARRLEQRLCEDERTAELGIRILVRGDRMFAQGQVMSEERRRHVLEVVRELEPEAEIHDMITVSGDALKAPATAEVIDVAEHHATGEATSHGTS